MQHSFLLRQILIYRPVSICVCRGDYQSPGDLHCKSHCHKAIIGCGPKWSSAPTVLQFFQIYHTGDGTQIVQKLRMLSALLQLQGGHIGADAVF